MRVYFLSYRPAVLKLNGAYVGVIDGFERFSELELNDKVFAEIIPLGGFQPLNFFIDEKLLSAPPAAMDLYLCDGEILINVREYAAANGVLDVILQTRFGKNLVTVFSLGTVYLSVDGAKYGIFPLNHAFLHAKACEKVLCGFPVLEIRSGDFVILLGADGEKIFSDEVIKIEYGEKLAVWTAFETCTAARSERAYIYDGERLFLTESKTVETVPPDENILHFAFFESVLTRGDFKRYLDDSMLQKADAIFDYLGDFVRVIIPTEKFYAEHENPLAAGLCYRTCANVFEVKYFAAEITDGKIRNIYPVE